MGFKRVWLFYLATLCVLSCKGFVDITGKENPPLTDEQIAAAEAAHGKKRTPAPTPSPSPTATPTASPTASPTATSTPTASPTPTAGLDEFGIREIYPTASGSGNRWNSLHWANGIPRSLTGYHSRDSYDPFKNSSGEGITMHHGSGWVEIDGNGIMKLKGTDASNKEPRFYLYDKNWQNVEVTVYYRRITDDNVSYAGLVIGARGGKDGHDPDIVPTVYCTARTYYTAMQNDGREVFDKELEHPTSGGKSISDPTGLGVPPFNQWIGMKFIVYNVSNGVRLEQWRDMTDGASGGNWVKIGSYTDTGGWAPPSNCGYPVDDLIREAGTVFIRNTGTDNTGVTLEAQYKRLVVREIVPPS